MPASQQSTSLERPRNWVAALRGFAAAAMPNADRCELCGAAIATTHPHLIEPGSRRFVCACPDCADGVQRDVDASGLRRVPERSRRLEDFAMSEAEWHALSIPIGLAFFFASADGSRVTAMYPGAAGAVEWLLDLASWRALVAANPSLATMRPEVEALLVNRLEPVPRSYIAPIDLCYALAGMMRSQWHGFSGGAAVRESVERFFADLDENGRAQPAPCHA